jgi:hypothetical protein
LLGRLARLRERVEPEPAPAGGHALTVERATATVPDRQHRDADAGSAARLCPPSSRFAAPRNVARRAAAFSRLGLVARPALINGAAGWVSLLDGEAFAVAALTQQNGRITTMDILLHPARLARLDLTVFD